MAPAKEAGTTYGRAHVVADLSRCASVSDARRRLIAARYADASAGITSVIAARTVAGVNPSGEARPAGLAEAPGVLGPSVSRVSFVGHRNGSVAIAISEVASRTISRRLVVATRGRG